MLVIILGFTLVFSGTMLHTSTQHNRSVREVVRHYERQLARNAGSSAANMAVSQLYRDFSWRDGYSDLDFGESTATVQVTDESTDPRTGVPTALVTAFGEIFGENDTTTVRLVQPAYSYFGMWLEFWPSFWTLSTGDTVTTSLHCNRAIQISGTPVFYGRVSSADSWYSDMGGADPEFLAGAEFAAPNIPMPSFTTVIDSANAGGDVYSSDATFVFNGDGTYNWSSAGNSGVKSITDSNGILLVNLGDAYVSGVVDGQVTVVSTGDLYIEGSVTCAVSPEDDPTSDDLVALLAEQNVIVVDNAANANGVELHASIAALQNFRVENYDSGPARGDLRLVGSMLANLLEPFGTWSSGLLQTGYRFVHIADRRLRTQRAPFFPIASSWVEVIDRIE